MWEADEPTSLSHSDSVEGSLEEEKEKDLGVSTAARMVPEV